MAWQNRNTSFWKVQLAAWYGKITNNMKDFSATISNINEKLHQFVDFRYKDIEIIPVLVTAYYLFTFSTNVSYNNKNRKMETIQVFSNKKDGSVNYRKKNNQNN